MKNHIVAILLVGILGTNVLFSQEKANLPAKTAEVKLQKAKFAVPEKYKTIDLFEITSTDFTSIAELKQYGLKLVDDPNSATGKAMAVQNQPEEFYSKDFTMGVQGRVSKRGLSFVRIKKNQIPQDEKYHFYSLRKIMLESNTVFWGHETWHFQQKFDKWFNSASMNKNKVEVWVSLKFTGPAYVRNSKQGNGIFIDRFLLIPVR